MIRTTALASLSLLALSSAAFAQDVVESEQADFIVETVAGGLEFPWSIAFLPSGEMLVTEREGRLRVIDADGLREAPVSGLPEDILIERQGGLLDVALAPDFADSRTIYFSYAEGGVICPRHVVKMGHVIPIPMVTLKLLRHMQRSPFAQVRPLTVAPALHEDAERILLGYITYLLERRLQSVDFIRLLQKSNE